MSSFLVFAFFVVVQLVLGHSPQRAGDQLPLTEFEAAPQTWLEKYGRQIDQPFSGPLAFSHLPYTRCLENEEELFDIAILGIPFDTGKLLLVPSLLSNLIPFQAYHTVQGKFPTNIRTISSTCVFAPKLLTVATFQVNPFDNALAVDQMEVAYSTLPLTLTQKLAKGGVNHPRIVSLGGDHTIVWTYGPISVIHFDAHLSKVTHGTFFHLAQQEGLMTNTSIHAGIRCKLGVEDLDNDESVGFQLISTDDIDDLGVSEIIRRIRHRVGTSPVYLSLDIDVIDPGIAPASKAGGWTTRELKRIIRGLAGLNFVGADLVEVSPAYDVAEVTAIAAADLVHDFLSMFLSEEPPHSHPRTRRVPPKDEL
ncbi:Arginase/deacetylase [Mycena metata]|uniref:Arginase/deacetylase n=1 Tax=Mycena metata TaxID=1033252 RepID=A0AAD7NEI2_9AGAR|nr:Arginase/deacetylase [Mycena metata]